MMRRHIALFVATWLQTAAAAHAGTLHVANDGVDGPACGGKSAPCRSISAAIDRASDGDKIVVGPGHYGDLDGDRQSDPGDEQYSHGMITIAKRLTLESRDGAAATVIDTGGGAQDAVRIAVSGVVFGKPGKGFTVTGADFGGIAMDASGVIIDAPGGVTVAGNTFVGNALGIRCFSGPENAHLLTANRVVRNGVGVVSSGCRTVGNELTANALGAFLSGTGGELRGNRIIGSTTRGVTLRGAADVRVMGNVIASSAGTGIWVSPTGSGHRIEGNAVTDNAGHGIDVETPNVTLTRNVVARNLGDGLFVDATGVDASGNSFVGNAGSGLNVASTATVTATNSNFIGNFRNVDGFRCGIWNFSDGAVDATGSYWGAASGPGDAPADTTCNDASGSVLTAPFAAKELKVKVKAPVIK